MVEDELSEDFIIVKNVDLRIFARGLFIENMMKIESFLSNCIASHFCKDDKKAEEFSELILNDRMTFGRKAELLKSIINNNYPNVLKKEPKFFIKLNELIEFRNKLAHSIGVGKEKDIREKGADYFTLAVSRRGEIKEEKITIKQLLEKEKDAEYVFSILFSFLLDMVLPEEAQDLIR